MLEICRFFFAYNYSCTVLRISFINIIFIPNKNFLFLTLFSISFIPFHKFSLHSLLLDFLLASFDSHLIFISFTLAEPILTLILICYFIGLFDNFWNVDLFLFYTFALFIFFTVFVHCRFWVYLQPV